jgi:hypothetical protein
MDKWPVTSEFSQSKKERGKDGIWKGRQSLVMALPRMGRSAGRLICNCNWQ